MKRRLAIILLVFSFSSSANAQHFTHDIGFFIGGTSLQTDYGQRGDFSSNFSNQGLSFTIAHYLHFFNRNMRWSAKDEMYNYIMVKTEINYIGNRQLVHFGKFANSNSESGKRLRAMKGSVSMINFGINLEYYFKNLEEFIFPYSNIRFNPFISFGGRFVVYNNDLSSDLGDWREDRSILPEKYRPQQALDIGTGTTFAATLSAGIRYKFTENLDLSTQISYQYFFSDSVDGLTSKTFENKNNEVLLNFQLGIIYHLNFSSPLFY